LAVTPVKGRARGAFTREDASGRPMGTSRRRGSKVTLADVARRAGVSSTTASFVLSGRDMGISTPTAARVVEAARALGYDLAARRRRGRGPRMPVIGLVTDTARTDQHRAALLRDGSALRRGAARSVDDPGGHQSADHEKTRRAQVPVPRRPGRSRRRAPPPGRADLSTLVGSATR
jgi:transcriptional regulator with XRE-family HTH domain